MKNRNKILIGLLGLVYLSYFAYIIYQAVKNDDLSLFRSSLSLFIRSSLPFLIVVILIGSMGTIIRKKRDAKLKEHKDSTAMMQLIGRHFRSSTALNVIRDIRTIGFEGESKFFYVRIYLFDGMDTTDNIVEIRRTWRLIEEFQKITIHLEIVPYEEW